MEVAGLDPSEGAVEVCRRRGVREVVAGTVHDVRDVAAFDTFLLLGNNLGLLGGRDSAELMLDRLADLARGSAAQVLATGVGRERGSVGDESDRAYVEANLARGRLPWQVTMRSRFADLATDWFDYVFLRVDELAELLEPSRWRIADSSADGPGYAVRLVLRER